MIDPNLPLDKVNAASKNTMMEWLGMRITELGSDYIIATMPVNNRTHQPAGLLHGGASAALIESLGSFGSYLIVDKSKYGVVGLEINANHLRAKRDGIVTGYAKIIHCGRKTHVWQCDIKDEEDKLICTGRLTVMVTPLA
ncbi:hotdog fold thioesterase [Paracrocinitomix mangrovi]|uniref:hotdog fold thioesterase n=1 Tax=Paracrocinitomix mangrovi TaxID=2862509 RepID=UPI001C8DD43A|nr:hotdog fold thioesterase [Paracrocinitomix mangrovi]UKN01387.1 hotdog fold thioesterase [Paracrocinitomix mangrovi]